MSAHARKYPEMPAIIEANGGSDQAPDYRITSYAALDAESDRIAKALLQWGVQPGQRLVLLVPFGAQFITFVLALLKARIVAVMVDPGMGRNRMLDCLQELSPDGFITIPKVQGMRWLMRGKFPQAKWNVTVNSRWGWGGTALRQLLRQVNEPLPLTQPDPSELAAVIFTTGSTGPPKGVAYTQAIFQHQVDLIQTYYGLESGNKDLACFPLFGLFDCVMGMTTVIPRMDPTRPADVDTRMILDAVRRYSVEQSFGSPALWNTVVGYCKEHHETIPQLKRVLSAGAPVPPHVLQGLQQIIHPEGQIYTPYGATESLPIASIESRTVVNETAARTRQGAGTCVGSRFPQIEWKVIEITDGPIDDIREVREVCQGSIGELMVTGPVVTREYVTRKDQNALHKVVDGKRVWHRMGDVGYLDEYDRFWFCGRKSQRVQTGRGVLFTEPCEAIMNAHPAVYRSALVGAGERGGEHPVLVIEPWEKERPKGVKEETKLIGDLETWAKSHPQTEMITDIRIYPERLPVDIRHNSKIFREQLAQWVVSGYR